MICGRCVGSSATEKKGIALNVMGQFCAGCYETRARGTLGALQLNRKSGLIFMVKKTKPGRTRFFFC